MDHTIRVEQRDGRWIASIEELPGIQAYGETADSAKKNAIELAEEIETEQLRMRLLHATRRRSS